VGCHSRPAFLKSPRSSFLLASTEMTAGPGAENLVPGVEMLELRVAIRVMSALAGSCVLPVKL